MSQPRLRDHDFHRIDMDDPRHWRFSRLLAEGRVSDEPLLIGPQVWIGPRCSGYGIGEVGRVEPVYVGPNGGLYLLRNGYQVELSPSKWHRLLNAAHPLRMLVREDAEGRLPPIHAQLPLPRQLFPAEFDTNLARQENTRLRRLTELAYTARGTVQIAAHVTVLDNFTGLGRTYFDKKTGRVTGVELLYEGPQQGIYLINGRGGKSYLSPSARAKLLKSTRLCHVTRAAPAQQLPAARLLPEPIVNMARLPVAPVSLQLPVRAAALPNPIPPRMRVPLP